MPHDSSDHIHSAIDASSIENSRVREVKSQEVQDLVAYLMGGNRRWTREIIEFWRPDLLPFYGISPSSQNNTIPSP
jgi:hypothetical protein